MFIQSMNVSLFFRGVVMLFLFMCHPKLSLRNGKECSGILQKIHLCE